MNLPSPPVLSYDELRSAADQFLREYWPSRAVPIDVEHIADVRIGIDIVPVPFLLDDSDIDGLLAADRSTIWVDETALLNRRFRNRYRFTLAHELGHWYLHGDLFAAAEFSSPEEWRGFLTRIPEEDRSWWEWQAYSFGGLILVQEEPLEEELHKAKENAASGGFDLELALEPHRQYVADFVASRFEVSPQVILKRGYYDDYWDAP